VRFEDDATPGSMVFESPSGINQDGTRKYDMVTGYLLPEALTEEQQKAIHKKLVQIEKNLRSINNESQTLALFREILEDVFKGHHYVTENWQWTPLLQRHMVQGMMYYRSWFSGWSWHFIREVVLQDMSGMGFTVQDIESTLGLRNGNLRIGHSNISQIDLTSHYISAGFTHPEINQIINLYYS
jgi:hypothetical protein